MMLPVFPGPVNAVYFKGPQEKMENLSVNNKNKSILLYKWVSHTHSHLKQNNSKLNS